MRLALIAALIIACAIARQAAAAPYTAPGNKVLWGGQGGYSAGDIADFEGQSGKHPAVFNFFVDWGARDEWLEGRLEAARRMGSRAMLSLSTSGTRLSPRDLAQGGGDGLLLRLNALLADHGEVVYLRPLSEMNNANNPYSAYDLSGHPRGPAFSPRQFKRAWRRLTLIVRGGEVTTIDANLPELGLPALRTGRPSSGAPRSR